MVSRDSIVDGDWLRATNWCHGYDRIIRTLRNWRNIDGWAACTERTAQGKEFELILMVKMKNRHPVEELLESEFPGICNHCVVMRAWSRMTWKFCEQFLHFFGKATPYGKIFKILLRKFSPPHWSTLLCLNVVNFVRREISEIARYLPHKKKQNFGCLSNCRYCTDRAQNLPGHTSSQHLAHTVPDFLQIGLLSAEPNAWTPCFCPVEYFHDSPETKHRFGRIKMETRHPV